MREKKGGKKRKKKREDGEISWTREKKTSIHS